MRSRQPRRRSEVDLVTVTRDGFLLYSASSVRLGHHVVEVSELAFGVLVATTVVEDGVSCRVADIISWVVGLGGGPAPLFPPTFIGVTGPVFFCALRYQRRQRSTPRGALSALMSAVRSLLSVRNKRINQYQYSICI